MVKVTACLLVWGFGVFVSFRVFGWLGWMGRIVVYFVFFTLHGTN